MRSSTRTAFIALALVCAASCKDGTSPNPITNLVPPDEPNLVDMSLTIGGATVVVSKGGDASGQIVVRPGDNAVSATFLKAGDVPDPHVNGTDFRIQITLTTSPITIFTANTDDGLTGTFNIPGPGDYTIHVVLIHVTKGHNDWNTDISHVFVRN